MFEGRRIEVGDTALVRVVIDKLFPGHPNKRVQACLSSGSAILVDEADLVSLTPAPRPLVPGPALLDGGEAAGGFDVEVTAVGKDFALVTGYTDREIAVGVKRLRNIEGAAS
jgi:hypothetical protein